MAATPPHAEPEQITPSPLIGRDELNLAEFPIAILGTSRSKKEPGEPQQPPPKTIYFEDKHGRLTVTGSDKYGLPAAADSDVIVALIYLTKMRNDFRDVKVNFSRYELVKLLNWQDDGDSYKRLDLSFNRWTGVLLVYDKCWWNNRLKCYTSAKMHIIENVEIIDNDARRKAHLAGQNGLPLSCFKWDEKFIESCQADNLRQLNLDEYFSLKNAVSKRLYRFLGKRFYLQRDWTFDLNEIAFDRVGLSRSYADAYKIKEKLQPAIDELEAIGFLRPLDRDDRYSRIDRGQWTIRLVRQSPTLVAPQQSPLPAAEPEPPHVAELVQRGVTRATALDLAQQYPAERIAAKLEVFDWLTAKQDKRVEKSPAGYLVKSIENDYATPKGFKTKAQVQQEQEAAERKRQADIAASRRKQQDDAREREERKNINGYRDSRTLEQMRQLEADALAQADAKWRATYEEALPDMRKMVLGRIVADHIRRHRLWELEPA